VEELSRLKKKMSTFLTERMVVGSNPTSGAHTK